MGLIVDRNDYITKEEYQKLLDKQIDIFSKVESINKYVRRDYGYEYYPRKIIFTFDIDDDFYSFTMIGDNLYDKMNVKVDILNEIKLNISKINHSNIQYFGYKVWKLFESLKDYEKLKYDIDYYKNKIVDVVDFNEKEYFKDIYELISNIN